MRRKYALLLILFAGWSASCRKEENEVNLSGGAVAPSAQSVAENPNTAPGTEFVASPNPAPVVPGADRGQTTLSWKTKSTAYIEIHVDRPDGPLFCKGAASGSCQTGNWVTGGQVFFLQNSAAANPTDASATLAAVTVGIK